MAKTTSPQKSYSPLQAILVGICCGATALLIGNLIAEGTIKHDFDVLFPYIAVGVLLSILNFRALSKISIILLPPVYAMSGFGIVTGPLIMAYLGWERSSMNPTMILVVEQLPFLLFSTVLFNWYCSLANQKSSVLYILFAVATVVTSMLIFGDKYEIWMVQGAYLGLSALLMSLLHVGKAK